MGSKNSKFCICASRKNASMQMQIMEEFEPKNTMQDQGDNVDWKMMQLKTKPPHEFCPHCNRIVRTSTEVEAKLKYLMTVAENHFKQNRGYEDSENTKKKQFAGVKRFARDYYRVSANLEQILLQSVSQVIERNTMQIDEDEDCIYDEVTEDYIQTEESSVDLCNYYNEANQDEYEIPRCLLLPNSMWLY